MYILIAEDDRQLRKCLRDILKRCGHEIKDVGDGAELVEIALQKRPDLIITDLDMPNLSGQEAIKKIKTHPELVQVPVIIVSGYNGEGMGNFGAGCAALLSKPLDFGKLIAEIDRIRSGKISDKSDS
ncbi:MAG: hypothetical protein COT17_08030 [Elusimicrobia bacterium CG08_land_8_20_14_0_20_51_18]|nr:MAG: hypothetical protein COT17_08030 [Elusimicrobia bacterium CG08_land_8_20_14_0_20_51_18]